jgi:surfeit locus 1 family protein
MPDPATRPRRLNSLWAVVAIGLFLAAGFIALGVWQLERLAWKNELIQAVDARSTANPLDLNRELWLALDPEAIVYQRVTVSGTYRRDAALVQAVTVLGAGFWVMTPLLLPGDRSVLINRGFIPQGQDPVSVEGQAATVTGLLRVSEPDGGFLRKNDPGARRWYSRDVAAISTEFGLTDPADFFIDADEIAGDDVTGGLTVLTFSNNHLVYALTWFGLAAMVIGGLSYLLLDRFKAV